MKRRTSKIAALMLFPALIFLHSGRCLLNLPMDCYDNNNQYDAKQCAAEIDQNIRNSTGTSGEALDIFIDDRDAKQEKKDHEQGIVLMYRLLAIQKTGDAASQYEKLCTMRELACEYMKRHFVIFPLWIQKRLNHFRYASA